MVYVQHSCSRGLLLCVVVLFFQDGILFGMVGAYDWEGGVLKESSQGRIMPPREAFEKEFPLELKNHAAYLGNLTTYLQQTCYILIHKQCCAKILLNYPSFLHIFL